MCRHTRVVDGSTPFLSADWTSPCPACWAAGMLDLLSSLLLLTRSTMSAWTRTGWLAFPCCTGAACPGTSSIAHETGGSAPAGASLVLCCCSLILAAAGLPTAAGLLCAPPFPGLTVPRAALPVCRPCSVLTGTTLAAGVCG